MPLLPVGQVNVVHICPTPITNTQQYSLALHVQKAENDKVIYK